MWRWCTKTKIKSSQYWPVWVMLYFVWTDSIWESRVYSIMLVLYYLCGELCRRKMCLDSYLHSSFCQMVAFRMQSSGQIYNFNLKPGTGACDLRWVFYFCLLIIHLHLCNYQVVNIFQGGSESGVSGLFGLTVVRKLNLGSATAQLVCMNDMLQLKLYQTR